MKHRKKALIVLEGLFNGQTIDMELTPNLKHKVKIIRDRLVIVAIKTSGGFSKENSEEVYLTCDITLTDFIDMCNDMSDDEIFIIAANTSLTKINKKRETNVENKTE